MKFRNCFIKLVDIMGTIIFTIITVVCLVQIFDRYVLGKSLVWAEELSVQLMIWIAFLGAAKGVSQNAHTRLTVLVNAMPLKIKCVMMLLSNLLCAGFLVVLVRYGFSLVCNTWTSITIGTQIPMGLVYLAIPFCSIIMLVFLVLNSVDTIREMKTSQGGDKT